MIRENGTSKIKHPFFFGKELSQATMQNTLPFKMEALGFVIELLQVFFDIGC